MTIYFIEMEGSKAIKIGFTAKDDVTQRMAQLQTGQPTQLKLLGQLLGEQDGERALHVIFARYRKTGEWFEGPPIFRQFIQHAVENEWPWSYFRAYGVFERLLAEMASKVETLEAAAEKWSAKKTARAEKHEIMRQEARNAGWTPEAANQQVARQHRKIKEYREEIARLKEIQRELEIENARLLANFQQSAMNEWRVEASLPPPTSWWKPSAGNGA